MIGWNYLLWLGHKVPLFKDVPIYIKYIISIRLINAKSGRVNGGLCDWLHCYIMIGLGFLDVV